MWSSGVVSNRALICGLDALTMTRVDSEVSRDSSTIKRIRANHPRGREEARAASPGVDPPASAGSIDSHPGIASAP